MLNPAQGRVVDPILSEYARGYKQAGLVGTALFPRVPVAQYGGKVIEFGKEAFRLYNVKRAPGGDTKSIEFGYNGKPYAIVPGALEAKVPREWMRDASQVPGIDLASRAINLVLRAMALSHEYECSQIARAASNYDSDHKVALASGSRWGDAVDPIADINTGKEAIRSTIGIRPNTLMLSATSWSKLKTNAKLIERIKYTNADSLTLEMLKNLFEIQNIVVGEAVVATGADDDFGDVWGDDAVLAYVSTSSAPNNEEPSYGYSYYIDGHPAVEPAEWNSNKKSWVYGVSDDVSPVLSGMTAGYLIQNAGAD